MLNGNPRKTRKKGAEGIFKVLMVENFAKLRTDTKPQIQEKQDKR